VTRRRTRSVIILVGELVVAFAVWRQVTRSGTAYRLTSDLGRYFTIVTHGGTPYRDFAVEYPPGALALFWLLGRSSFDAFVHHMLLVNFACEAVVAAICFRGWGSRAGWSYVLLSTPLLVIVYSRYDLIVLAIAVAGTFLLARRQPTAAGLMWIVAALVKPWSLVLIPGLGARRHVCAFVTAIAAGACSLAAWVMWAGWDGPRQVLTYRDAKGWEAASVPGSLLRVFTRDPLRFESGSWRLGAPSSMWAVLLSLCLVVAVASTWWYRANHQVTDGVPEVVVIAATLTFVTLLSPQFVVWMLPWVAIAASKGAVRIERWAAAVVVLTLVSWALFDVNHAGRLSTEVAFLARNVALVGLLITAVTELGRGQIVAEGRDLLPGHTPSEVAARRGPSDLMSGVSAPIVLPERSGGAT